MHIHRYDFVTIVAVRKMPEYEIYEKQINPAHVRLWTERLKRNYETVFVCS